jgi:hypothetical protein
MSMGWKTRVCIVLSAIWLCLVFLLADTDARLGSKLGFGLFPLIVLWGVVWAVTGWRAQRAPKPELPEAIVSEVKRKRMLGLRSFFTVVAVLTIGVSTAVWQAHLDNNERAGNAVSYVLGQWIVYGLLAYGVFRSTAKIPRGLPAVLATIVVVGGVNYKTYAAISQDREAKISLAKAAPLLNKMQSGVQVSEQEIKSARIGLLEPLVLAQAAFGSDVIAISTAYTRVISDLKLEQMLTPTSLASRNIRNQSRVQLRQWQQATLDFKSQLQAAAARGRLGVQAAELQMPVAMSGSSVKGFDESVARLRAYGDNLVSLGNDSRDAVSSILDLMDANTDAYSVDKGPPANLLFSDEIVLGRYQQLIGLVISAGQRETEATAALVSAQSAWTEKFTDLLRH